MTRLCEGRPERDSGKVGREGEMKGGHKGGLSVLQSEAEDRKEGREGGDERKHSVRVMSHSDALWCIGVGRGRNRKRNKERISNA